MVKIYMPKKPTIGSMAEPVGTYLGVVGKMLGKVYNDKSICKKDKKWLREIVLYLINAREVMILLEAMNKVTCGKGSKKYG